MSQHMAYTFRCAKTMITVTRVNIRSRCDRVGIEGPLMVSGSRIVDEGNSVSQTRI